MIFSLNFSISITFLIFPKDLKNVYFYYKLCSKLKQRLDFNNEVVFFGRMHNQRNVLRAACVDAADGFMASSWFSNADHLINWNSYHVWIKL